MSRGSCLGNPNRAKLQHCLLVFFLFILVSFRPISSLSHFSVSGANRCTHTHSKVIDCLPAFLSVCLPVCLSELTDHLPCLPNKQATTARAAAAAAVGAMYSKSFFFRFSGLNKNLFLIKQNFFWFCNYAKCQKIKHPIFCYILMNCSAICTAPTHHSQSVHTDHPYSPRPVRVTLYLTRVSLPYISRPQCRHTSPVGSQSAATGHEPVPISVPISLVSPHLILLYSPITDRPHQ